MLTSKNVLMCLSLVIVVSAAGGCDDPDPLTVEDGVDHPAGQDDYERIFVEEMREDELIEAEGSSREQLAFAASGGTKLVTCSGNGCNGLDPETTPCASDAITAQTKSIYATISGKSTYVGYVQLRWSNACKTNWARVTRTDGAFKEGMNAQVQRSDGFQKFASKKGYTTIWSPMVYAPSPFCAKANGLIDLSITSGYAQTNCY